MSTTTKSLSALQMSVRLGIHQITAKLFMHKAKEAMKSSENMPMKDKVHVDKFVFVGHENGKIRRRYNGKKKKSICALELTEKGKSSVFMLRK